MVIIIIIIIITLFIWIIAMLNTSGINGCFFCLSIMYVPY